MPVSFLDSMGIAKQASLVAAIETRRRWRYNDLTPKHRRRFHDIELIYARGVDAGLALYYRGRNIARRKEV